MALRRAAPLTNTFLIISIFGFIISMYLVFPMTQITTESGPVSFDGTTWGFAFAFVFFCMFCAAMISMRRAAPDEQLRR
ncbi:hypothetical protein HY641_02435 [Candidatus Woesearchaeota archaeon]|nr:hypothetical protein [Candidatus Woesearchaeota archaeon]